MDGQRPVVVIEDAEAPAFYAAARSISVTLDRENLDWQKLLTELHTACSRRERPDLALADPRGPQAVGRGTGASCRQGARVAAAAVGADVLQQSSA